MKTVGAEESFLVSEGNLPDIGAVVLRAAQVPFVIPCSPPLARLSILSVWLRPVITLPRLNPARRN
jgi:hypothetical protein